MLLSPQQSTCPRKVSAGAAYFWRVEALADGITATSAAQRLNVAP